MTSTLAQDNRFAAPELRLDTGDASGDVGWIEQLRIWKAGGTFARLNDARKARQPVSIKRSDGRVSIGVIFSVEGFGGREVTVEFDTDAGKRFKHVYTEDFLEFNPGFGPALKHLC